MTEYYLWMLQVMGAANARTHKIIDYFGGVIKAFEAISEGNTSFLSDYEKSLLANASLKKSKQIMDYCSKKDIEIITLENEDYPFRLKQIYNPPILLFVKGNIKGIDDEICIAAVGTRKPSDYSIKLTYRVCSDLSKLGVVIISGLAFGLDSVSHKATVDTKGRTIGVLACGIGINYPSGSAALKKQIVDIGGAYVTELLPFEKVNPIYFHARNRIISGLSMGVIIFEADKKSGSLITANHAVSQNRDLFCVPPADVFDPRYAGVVGYLRDGAIAVYNHLDIVNEYYRDFSEKLKELKNKSNLAIDPSSDFMFKKAEAKNKTEKSKENQPKKEVFSDKEYGELPEKEAKIIEILKSKQRHIDYIVNELGSDHLSICETLMEMELSGYIEACVGGTYKLV